MRKSERLHIASAILKIAQEIMEYSGADANLFGKKSSDSYDVVGDDGRVNVEHGDNKRKK